MCLIAKRLCWSTTDVVGESTNSEKHFRTPTSCPHNSHWFSSAIYRIRKSYMSVGQWWDLFVVVWLTRACPSSKTGGAERAIGKYRHNIVQMGTPVAESSSPNM